jgi:hypothetical protein
MVTPMEYASLHCLVKKRKVPSPKPLLALRDQEKAYKPKYHDPGLEGLTKPQYKLIKIGDKKVLICTRQKQSPIIKVIKNEIN